MSVGWNLPGPLAFGSRGFANSLPVLFPFSAFILITLAVAKSDALTVALTPFTLLQGAFYPMALFVVFAVSVVTGVGRQKGEYKAVATTPKAAVQGV